MGLDGNEEQNNRAAEHLLAVWDAKREREAKEKPRGVDWKGSLPAWFALAISLGTLIWNAAVVTQRVDQNATRIQRFEAAGLDSAIARLESKVDILIEDRSRELNSGGR